MGQTEETLVRLDQLTWPISWRFTISAPWGQYAQVITVEAPELFGEREKSQKLGELVYQSLVASATTFQTRCIYIETVVWRGGSFPWPSSPDQLRGDHFAASTARHDTGVLVLHTGHADGLARRRFYLGGMPSTWTSGRLLNVEGAERLQELARGMIVGLVTGSGHLPMRLLLAYPRKLDLGGVFGPVVGFRFVEHIRVCQYTERAPDLSEELWP